MRQALLCVLALAAFAGAAGCGDDDVATSGAGRDTSPFVSLSEARRVVEQGRPAVVRTGAPASIGGVDGDPSLADDVLVDAARYATQSGREFDLFVFATPAAARRAAPSVADPADGESAFRAANVVARFPASYDDVDAYRAVTQSLRALAVACAGEGRGERRLRDVCFGDGTVVPPPGAGTERDAAQGEEKPIVVDGLHYDPLLARRLNPHLKPDETMLRGRSAPAGKIWFGVFVRVCNRGDHARTSSDQVALVDAFGTHVEPSGALAADNPYAYRSRSLRPGRCLPAAGSVAERADGALILFAVERKLLANVPVALEVEDRRVILDV